jgi:hypothetical protein
MQIENARGGRFYFFRAGNETRMLTLAVSTLTS